MKPETESPKPRRTRTGQPPRDPALPAKPVDLRVTNQATETFEAKAKELQELIDRFGLKVHKSGLFMSVECKNQEHASFVENLMREKLELAEVLSFGQYDMFSVIKGWRIQGRVY